LLGDAKSSLGDAERLLGDAESSLGDAQLLGEDVAGMSDAAYEGYNYRRHHVGAAAAGGGHGGNGEAELEEDTEEQWDEALEDQLYTIAEKESNELAAMMEHLRTYVASTASEPLSETSTSSELGTTLKDGGVMMMMMRKAEAAAAVVVEAEDTEEERLAGEAAAEQAAAWAAVGEAAAEEEEGEEEPALVRAMSCLSGKFLLDGHTLHLPSLAAIGMEASLAQRVEALREFLEGELGDMPFIRCVRSTLQRCEKAANRNARVWHGATEKGPLNDGQIPNVRGVRVALGSGDTRVEGNRKIAKRPRAESPTRNLVPYDSQLSHRCKPSLSHGSQCYICVWSE
jgi:hypothetical protein